MIRARDVIADAIYVAGTAGRWCVPLSRVKKAESLTRTDSLIAFNALHGGVVIGRHEIRSR